MGRSNKRNNGGAHVRKDKKRNTTPTQPMTLEEKEAAAKRAQKEYEEAKKAAKAAKKAAEKEAKKAAKEAEKARTAALAEAKKNGTRKRAFQALENGVVVAGPFHTPDEAMQASRTGEFEGVTVWVLPNNELGPRLTPEEMQALS